MKKILVINGHPDDKSLCGSLVENYMKGAQGAGNEVRLLSLGQLKFDPILHHGYRVIQPLEPDLERAQADILWADHLVFVYPIWWGTVPAVLKGFLDRVFLPGFSFKYRKDSPFWDRLLRGKTGHIILTTDAPWWWNFFVNGDPSIRMMKKTVLEFCGVTPVKVTQFDSIKTRKPEQIKKFITRAYQLGAKVK